MRVPNVATVLHALAALVLASNAMAAVSFSATGYKNPTGSAIALTASGDFNGDGTPDLVVVGPDHVLSYFEGVGDGTFGSPITTDIGANTTDKPWSVVVADFNGDGNLDIAIGYWFGNTMFTLHFGDGLGHFSSGLQLTTGHGGPLELATGDFDGDGHPDLAYAYDFPPSAVWIHFGNGDGTFKPPVAVYTGSLAGGVVAADVNNDGRLDLISGPGTIVLLNVGAGTFTPVVNPPGSGALRDIAVGDLNGDGNLDLVTGEYSFSSLEPTGSYIGCVHVYLGDGQGHFAEHFTSVPCGYSSGVGGGIALADINTDGTLDIVTGGIVGNIYFGFAGLQVFLGDGTGDFTSSYTLAAPWGTFIIDDFNRDGRPDVVATNTPNDPGAPRPAGDRTVIAVLINTSPYGCMDSLTLNYTANTLTMGFTIKSAIPTQWSTWIAWQNNIAPLWSVPIPAVPAQVSFTLPIPGVPPIGNIGVLTTMSSSTFGLMCGDWKVVDTGGIGPSAQTLSNMVRSLPRSQAVP